MFSKIFKNKNAIYSPVKGKCISIEKVNDSVFSDKLLGDGVAFEFEDEFVCAPCFGTIVMVAPTKHAIGFKMNNGAEVLIHIGLNTVDLMGKGFKLLVQVGERVRPGDQLVFIDRQLMKENNIDLTTMVIITNGDQHQFTVNEEKEVSLKEELFIIN